MAILNYAGPNVNRFTTDPKDEDEKTAIFTGLNSLNTS